MNPVERALTQDLTGLLDRLAASLPEGGFEGIRMAHPGLKGKLVADFTDFLNDSISEVMHTLAEAMIIVIIVIYLFLGSFRSVVIPIVAIPLSLVGACALMLALGTAFVVGLVTGFLAFGRFQNQRKKAQAETGSA